MVSDVAVASSVTRLSMLPEKLKGISFTWRLWSDLSYSSVALQRMRPLPLSYMPAISFLLIMVAPVGKSGPGMISRSCAVVRDGSFT